MVARRLVSSGTKTRVSRPPSIATLRREARACRACPLWRHATQTVFGEGPPRARIMLIGEQAGDREDLEGVPFVGPAGRVLDQGLADAGLDRAALYITNVIKHFKFEQRGKRRLHKRANAAEVGACVGTWLDRELESVAPHYVVCLGALAARVIFGTTFQLQRQRGTWLRGAGGRWCLATVHPSFVLRARIGGGYDAAYRAFVADLAKVDEAPA